MSNVIEFNGTTTAKIDADQVLDQAKGELDQVVVIGVCKNGQNYIASSTSEVAAVNLMLDCGKRDLFNMSENLT